MELILPPTKRISTNEDTKCGSVLYVLRKMADWINIHWNGIPVTTLGMAGITTAILAYVTVSSDSDSTPAAADSKKSEEPGIGSQLASMNPFSGNKEPEVTESKEQVEEPREEVEAESEPKEEAISGGKKKKMRSGKRKQGGKSKKTGGKKTQRRRRRPLVK